MKRKSRVKSAFESGRDKAAALLTELKIANAAFAASGGLSDTPEQRAYYETLSAVKAQLSTLREPSQAAKIGDGGSIDERKPAAKAVKAHRFTKAIYRSGKVKAQPGDLIRAIVMSRMVDSEAQAEGKALLRALNIPYADDGPMFAQYAGMLGGPSYTSGAAGKATLGATGATGGYVLPNNLVDTVVKPRVAQALYTAGDNPLCTLRTGIAVRGVDQPYRTGAPTRATFQDWGTAKENLDEAYGSYTAYLGTIARIYDVGKQYLRFSAGSAEVDVFDELGKAFRLGENYYVIAGQGTGTVGSGDPTVGVYTALVASDPAFTTTFVGASLSTIAGNACAAIADGMSALAGRSRMSTAVVMDYLTYHTLVIEGSNEAGFYLSGAAMGGARSIAMRPDGQLEIFGCPAYWDPNFNTNSGTSKHCILGEWDALRVLKGMEFRIDTSDTAGDRWDKNLVGFRGEEEFGLNAGTPVATGAFQLVKAIIP